MMVAKGIPSRTSSKTLWTGIRVPATHGLLAGVSTRAGAIGPAALAGSSTSQRGAPSSPEKKTSARSCPRSTASWKSLERSGRKRTSWIFSGQVAPPSRERASHSPPVVSSPDAVW